MKSRRISRRRAKLPKFVFFSDQRRRNRRRFFLCQIVEANLGRILALRWLPRGWFDLGGDVAGQRFAMGSACRRQAGFGGSPNPFFGSLGKRKSVFGGPPKTTGEPPVLPGPLRHTSSRCLPRASVKMRPANLGLAPFACKDGPPFSTLGPELTTTTRA